MCLSALVCCFKSSVKLLHHQQAARWFGIKRVPRITFGIPWLTSVSLARQWWTLWTWQPDALTWRPNTICAKPIFGVSRVSCICPPFRRSCIVYALSNCQQLQLQSLQLQPTIMLADIYVKIQEAQLPQRNSASAGHVYLGWLTDRAMRRTPQNRRGCTISDIQTLWFKKCWPKTHFVMK